LDRQLIANLVVQYITNKDQRNEIVGILSGTLCFTPEQQEAIGLNTISMARGSDSMIKESNSPASAAPSTFQQSLSDKWISFLLKEVNTDDTKENQSKGS
jgi:hypothetical protein